MKPLVAVTTYYDRDLIGPALAPLRERAEVRFGPPVGRNLQASELVEALAGAAAVIAADERYDASILAAVPALRIIAREGAGYNGIDVAEATRRGIAVTNAPVVHEATATMALGLMFAVVRKLLICDRAVRAGRWTDRGLFLNPGLDGLTLGLIGFGMIGRGVARRALPCGLRVLAHSRSLTAEEAERHGVTAASFERVLVDSDIVSLHVPLTEQTRGLIGAAELAAMQRGAYLINTCRGPVVDEAALIDALASGHLAGAGLDVLADEPPDPGNPLLSMEQVTSAIPSAPWCVPWRSPATVPCLDGRTPPNLLNRRWRCDANRRFFRSESQHLPRASRGSSDLNYLNDTYFKPEVRCADRPHGRAFAPTCGHAWPTTPMLTRRCLSPSGWVQPSCFTTNVIVTWSVLIVFARWETYGWRRNGGAGVNRPIRLTRCCRWSRWCSHPAHGRPTPSARGAARYLTYIGSMACHGPCVPTATNRPAAGHRCRQSTLDRSSRGGDAARHRRHWPSG